jgi:predicted CXXCH cytochrome family protein
MKNFTKKRDLFLISIFVTVLFLNGCGGGGTSVKSVAEEVSAQKVEKVAQEIAKEEEKIEVATVPAVKKELVFEPNLKQSKKVVHPPYGTKLCSMCHKSSNPKDGNDLAMEQPDLCYQCHDKDAKEGKKFIHGPVAAGACTICHNPHDSENSSLLRYSNVNELCTSCHSAKGEFLKNTENIHPPVEDSCVNCHDPHTEDYEFQLRADRKKDICLTCHVDKQDWINSVRSKHGAINMGSGCQNCHDPHGTGQPKMMKAATVKDMCLKCHSQELITDEEGYKLQNIGKHLDENPDWHGPIQWGDCAMCHNPHGSDNLRMLNKPFPKTFYAKFDEKNYICFECHDADKIKKARTIEDTNFRNGNSNMHFVHVNKDKGRTCRACHDFHGTKDYPHHLKKKTQFGKISFPLRFIETPTGGSCAPACHARRGYDRENPIKNLK